MNKKLLPILLIVLLVLFLLFLLLKSLFGGGSSSTNSPKANAPEVESRVTWTQKQMSTMVFSTNEYPNGGNTEDIKEIHVVYTGMFGLSVSGNEKIKDFSISVVKFSQGAGKPVVYKTPHNKALTARSFIYEPMETETHTKDLVDGGKTIKFSVVNSNPTYYDEVLNQMAFPNFLLFSKSLGTISYKTIMARDSGFDGAKLLHYLGTKAADLNGEIVLDFNITFDDGKKYVKRMGGVVNGEKLLKEMFYTIEFTEVQ